MKSLLIFIMLSFFHCWAKAETVGLFFDSQIDQIQFAATDVKASLESKSYTVELYSLASLTGSYPNKKVVITLSSDNTTLSQLTNQGGSKPTGLGEQAYALRTTTSPQKSYWIVGGDANGAMYGAFQIAENIAANGYSNSYTLQESPFLLNRGMKLNMPLDRRIPTYVGGWSSASTGKAIPHVWDMSFWKTLIDQQARYRYNVLSVWVHHPFPALVKLPDYPNAVLPQIEGFNGYVKSLNHDQRVAFWREVMQYAHKRGMKFYFFNWNIYVDYATTMYPAITRDQTNQETINYMYKSMQALIQTYPELDGFGISAGDGMDGPSESNTAWTWNAMGKAVADYLEANPTRKFNLIHRGIGTSVSLWNTQYAPLKSLSNAETNYSVKYAQAHMYSTPIPQWTSAVQDVAKIAMKTWLTIRNDDFFYLNWGDPKFVRDYMNGIPEKQCVVGMYIGSDGYTPSRTYFYKNPTLNGQLEVERRWYMEMLWGRISYNPSISDDVFINMLAKRFPTVSSSNLFQAWSLASRPLPKVTELIMREWSLDFHWYPEGCLSDPGRETGFRTIDDFANLTSVAKGSNLCDIPNSAAGTCSGKKSTYVVADEMQTDAESALSLINGMNSGSDLDLEIAINNVKQMAYLSLYYAHKVRGATYKKAGQTTNARNEMAKAYCAWMAYTRLMENDYYGDTFRNMKIQPDWKFADAAVLKEYTDLGGTGTPICGDKSYSLLLSSNDTQKGTTLGTGLYNPGDVVTITAVPNPGYRFTCWKENEQIVSTDIQYKFPIDKDQQLVAVFVEKASCAFPWTDLGFTVTKSSTVTNTYGPIDISCSKSGVSIHVDVESIGTDNSDYCGIYYKVNEGTQRTLLDQKGAFPLRKIFSEKIIGNTLELILIGRTSASDEFINFSNVKVLDHTTTIKHDFVDEINIIYQPETNTLNIHLSKASIPSSIKIFNALGNMVYFNQEERDLIQINLQSISQKGLALVQIETEGNVFNRKILIK